MFTHILVPLDGSKLGETVVPVAAILAHLSGAKVTLVHVIEKNAPKQIHRERHLTDPGEAQTYLEEIAKTSFTAGTKVECHVHASLVQDVARSIVDHGEELQHDLVLMCTHGRSTARKWLFGSIAQQVIRLGQTPVLIIQPLADGSAPGFDCRKILVPLDGKKEHEQGLPLAVEIAKACKSIVHLLMVVPTYGTLAGESAATGKLLPGATAAVLDLAVMGGEEYLRRHLEAFQGSGLEVMAEVARGDPAGTIVKVAAEGQADLIVLGTHGKSGTEAFWSGSVPPKVSSQSHIPLLLVPVRD